MQKRETWKRSIAWLLVFVLVLTGMPQTAVNVKAEDVAPIPITESMVKLYSDAESAAEASDTTKWTYTGEEIMPGVKLVDGTSNLEYGEDYTVSYANNINAGEAEVIIDGIERYTGTVTKNFTIQELSLSAKKENSGENRFTVTNTNTNLTFVNIDFSTVEQPTTDAQALEIGKELAGSKLAEKPTFQVMDSETDAELKEGTDYTAEYWYAFDSSYKFDASKLAYSIQGNGNYSDTLTGQIPLEPLDISDTDKITVSFPDGANLYYLEEGYTTNAADNAAAVDIYKAFPYVEVKKNDSDEPAEVISSKAFDISINGAAGGTIKDVGTYDLILVPKEETTQYKNSATIPIKIKAIDLSSAVATSANDKEHLKEYPVFVELAEATPQVNYNGNSVAPEHIKLKYTVFAVHGDTVTALKESREYTAYQEEVADSSPLLLKIDKGSYQSNINAGTAELAVQAVDPDKNFTGKKQFGYLIKPLSLPGTYGDGKIKVVFPEATKDPSNLDNENVFFYDGTWQKPSVEVTYHYAEDKYLTLREDYDYSVGYGDQGSPTDRNNKDVGSDGKVTIKGLAEKNGADAKSSESRSGFYGSIDVDFVIAKNISSFKKATVKTTAEKGFQFEFNNGGYSREDIAKNWTLTVTPGDSDEIQDTLTYGETGFKIASVHKSSDGSTRGEELGTGDKIKSQGYYIFVLKPTDSNNYTDDQEKEVSIEVIKADLSNMGKTEITLGDGLTRIAEDTYAWPVIGNGTESSYQFQKLDAIEPSVSVKFDGVDLVKDTDYTLNYVPGEDSTSIKIVVKGTGSDNGVGNYENTATKTIHFRYALNADTISKGLFEVKPASDTYTYTGSEIKPEVIINRMGIDTEGKSKVEKKLVNGTDYTVEYVNNINVTSDESKAQIYVKGMGDYYTKETGDNVSETGHVKVADASFSITKLDLSTMKSRILLVNSATKDAGEVQYALSNGTGEIKVIGQYEDIDETSLPEALVDTMKQYYGQTDGAGANNYSPKESSLDNTAIRDVKGAWLVNADGSLSRLAPSSYTLSYTHEKDDWSKAGKATVKLTVRETKNITGQGTSLSRTFQVKRDIGALLEASDAATKLTLTAVEDSSEDIIYDGETKKPTVKVELGSELIATLSDGVKDSGTKLTLQYPAASDLEADTSKAKLYRDVTETDGEQPSFTVVADGSDPDSEYMGTATGYFQIQKADISEKIGKITLDGQENRTYTYNALEQKPKVIQAYLSDDETKEFAGENYTVSYSEDVTNVGTVTVTLTGQGNYTGTKETTYEIQKADLRGANLSIVLKNGASPVYNRQSQTPEDVNVVLNGSVVDKDNYDIIYYSVATDASVSTEPVEPIDAGRYLACAVAKESSKNYTGKTVTQASAVYTIEKASMENLAISYTEGNYRYDGTEKTKSFTVRQGKTELVEGTEYDVVFKNNINVGAATATLTGKGNYKDTVSVSYSIQQADINAACEVIVEDVLYDGGLKTPDVTVQRKDNGTVLKEGKDYSKFYTNNRAVGTANVGVVGLGNYGGMVVGTFKIKPSELPTSSSIAATTALPSSTATSTSLETPLPTGTASVDEPEESGLPSPSENAPAGATTKPPVERSPQAVVTHEPGQETLAPEESPAQTPIDQETTNPPEVVRTDLPIDVSTDAPEGAVTEAPDGMSTETPGDLSTEIPGDIPTDLPVDTTETPGVEPSSTPEVMGPDIPNTSTGPAITSGPAIVVTEEPVVITTEEPTALTSEEPVQDPNDLSNGSSIAVHVADVVTDDDGKAEAPVINITKADGTALVEGVDYTVTYTEDLETGIGTVTVTGIGEYSGTYTTTYMIGIISISEATVRVNEVYYNGLAQTPDAVVSLDEGATALTANVDYTMEYKDNIDAGKATVTVKGKGKYKDSVTGYFTIHQLPLASLDPTVTVSEPEMTFTGSALTPEVSIAVSTGAALVEDTDYVVRYKDNTNIGTATYTLSGKGNYSGSISGEFKITPPKKGFKKAVGGITYRVTDSSKYTVEVVSSTKSGTLKIPATTRIGGKTYNVTGIADKAFKGNKKITSVTIGSKVTTIGKEAFSGAKKIKSITLNGNVLKTVKKNAFKGVKKKCKIIIQAKNKATYKKVMKKIKASKTNKVKYKYKQKS